MGMSRVITFLELQIRRQSFDDYCNDLLSEPTCDDGIYSLGEEICCDGGRYLACAYTNLEQLVWHCDVTASEMSLIIMAEMPMVADLRTLAKVI